MKRAELLQILEHDSEWHTHISEQGRQTLPDWAVKVFEERGRKDAEASRKEFWDCADLITADWSKLTQARRKFIPLRNQ